MRKLVLAVAVTVTAGILGAASPAQAQSARDDDGAAPHRVDPKKAADIRKLIELTGGASLAKQMMAQMTPALKKMAPEAPESFWNELEEFDADELVELVVPIYDKHLSAQDVKALLTFYQSPSGQRVIKALPAIMAESMAAGQEWGQQIARRVLRRAQQHHYREGQGEDE